MGLNPKVLQGSDASQVDDLSRIREAIAAVSAG